jgi:hypothetical protein
MKVYRKQLVQRVVSQLKVGILCIIHFTVSAWQQVTQSTMQDCFVKCGHVKNQEGSEMTEVNRSGEDDVTQDEDWVWLGASTAGLDFDTYVSVDQELTTCCVLFMWCGVVWWEMQVTWRSGKVMVAMMMKPSSNQCAVLRNHFVHLSQ